MCLNPKFTTKRRSDYITPFNYHKDVNYSLSRQYVDADDCLRLPCGKCWECRQMTANDWTTRLVKTQEQLEQTSQYKNKTHQTYFVTLTYDEQNIPLFGDIDANGVANLDANCNLNIYSSLDKTHSQGFIKALKDTLWGKKKKTPLKYFVCGEYGGLTGRPHYHLILFNVPKLELVNTHKKSKGKDIWTNPLIQTLWNKGITQVDTEPIRSDAFSYVAGYVKKQYDKNWHTLAQAPYNNQSQGIGKLPIDEIISYVERKQTLRIIITDKHTRIKRLDTRAVPRYYIKLYNKHWQTKHGYTDADLNNVHWNILRLERNSYHSICESIQMRRDKLRNKQTLFGRAVLPLSRYRPLPTVSKAIKSTYPQKRCVLNLDRATKYYSSMASANALGWNKAIKELINKDIHDIVK